MPCGENIEESRRRSRADHMIADPTKFVGFAERGTPADRLARIAAQHTVLAPASLQKLRRQSVAPAIASGMVTSQILTLSSLDTLEAQLPVVLLERSR